jgi:hypothetical protein
MQYNDNNKWHNETLEELGQRIVWQSIGI